MSAQEYNDLRWWTGMPVAMMAGASIVQVRARGLFSVVVTDPTRFAAVVEDSEDPTGYLKSLAGRTMIDVLGKRSAQVDSAEELTGITDETAQAFQASLAARLGELGVQLKSLSIDAIDCV